VREAILALIELYLEDTKDELAMEDSDASEEELIKLQLLDEDFLAADAYHQMLNQMLKHEGSYEDLLEQVCIEIIEEAWRSD
jgi:hypothetical protein